MSSNTPNTMRWEQTLAVSLSEMEKLFDHFKEISSQLKISKLDQYHILLCLEESFVNIVCHGYSQPTTDYITVHYEYNELNHTLSILLQDQGIAYNPLKDLKKVNPDAPIEERRIGGLGVHLMHRLMDRITYERAENSNRLSLVKKLSQS